MMQPAGDPAGDGQQSRLPAQSRKSRRTRSRRLFRRASPATARSSVPARAAGGDRRRRDLADLREAVASDEEDRNESLERVEHAAPRSRRLCRACAARSSRRCCPNLGVADVGAIERSGRSNSRTGSNRSGTPRRSQDEPSADMLTRRPRLAPRPKLERQRNAFEVEVLANDVFEKAPVVRLHADRDRCSGRRRPADAPPAASRSKL